jgi:hypothetical protein
MRCGRRSPDLVSQEAGVGALIDQGSVVLGDPVGEPDLEATRPDLADRELEDECE